MSGTYTLTIGGGHGGVAGIVSIPSSLLFGDSTATGSVNNILQTYLGQIGDAVTSGAAGFINTDLADAAQGSVSGSGSSTLQEFTNLNPSTSVTGSSTGSYTASVASGVTDVLVQVPGTVTLTGATTATNLVFGADSNVDYNVTDPAAGTMYLAGGSDTVTLKSLNVNNAESIYSSGNDSINLVGLGTDYVSVYGNALVGIEAADAYVTAEGNATTSLLWDNKNAGGTLHFVNNSSAAAKIQIGIFYDSVGNAVQSATRVTAYGGAGGGYFVGGQAGNNSLVGGSGVVTLVGGGSADYLEANSSLGTNDFFAGAGYESLVASSTTGANLFSAGLNYPGLGQPQVSGIISTAGSGTQNYFLGNLAGGETVYGTTATAAGATNNYFLVSDATASGAQLSIYNFVDARSQILLTDGTGQAAGTATITAMAYDSVTGAYQIALSDHSVIQLKGLTNSEMNAIHTVTGSNGVITIIG